jgi:hypothetical protein
MTTKDVPYQFSLTVDPADPVNYLRAAAVIYGRRQTDLLRRVMFRSQDATRAAQLHDRDAHPSLYRDARKPCRWNQ